MTFQDQKVPVQQQQAQFQATSASAAKSQLQMYAEAHHRAVTAAHSAPAEARVQLQRALSALHEAVQRHVGIQDQVKRAFLNHPPGQRAALRQHISEASRSLVADALQQAKEVVAQFKTLVPGNEVDDVLDQAQALSQE